MPEIIKRLRFVNVERLTTFCYRDYIRLDEALGRND
jgi:hypothetical protein